MSRNQALEKVGRSRVAYALQQRGWKVGEAFDDGFDLLAHHPKTEKVALIEIKAMDIDNRAEGVNLTAPVSKKEQRTCTHIVAYVEPHGWYFIARKDRVITNKGNIHATITPEGKLRPPRRGSKSLTHYKDAWDQLFT